MITRYFAIAIGTVWSQVVATGYFWFSLQPIAHGHEFQDRPQPHGRPATYYEEPVPGTTALYRLQRDSLLSFAICQG